MSHVRIIIILWQHTILRYPEELKESLECDAEHVTQWFDSNGMKANPEKYHGIAFGTKPKQPTSFNERGTDIECSIEVIYSFMSNRVIDFDLKWYWYIII